MIKRFLSLMLALSIMVYAGGATAQAQALTLAQVSQYFNNMQTAQGGFRQFNADGSVTQGRIYIKRPGRIRFEYAPPERAMVIASGGQLAIFDPRSNTGPERYPLNQTPLNIILQRNVDLTRTDMVRGITSDGTTTTITAQDPDHPEYGSIQMVFTANPIALREWVVTDEFGGGGTRIVLDDLQEGGRIREIKFNIIAETQNWNK